MAHHPGRALSTDGLECAGGRHTGRGGNAYDQVGARIHLAEFDSGDMGLRSRGALGQLCLRQAGLEPQACERGSLVCLPFPLDSETTLAGTPAEAWEYLLGNRSVLEWILGQYRDKKPKDPAIREKLNTHRFTDYRNKVVDLPARVTTVSIRTVEITRTMAGVTHQD